MHNSEVIIFVLQQKFCEIRISKQLVPDRILPRLNILLSPIDNPINTMGERYLFSTEGHVFPIEEKFRKNIWEFFDDNEQTEKSRRQQPQQDQPSSLSDLNLNFGGKLNQRTNFKKMNESTNQHCDHFKQKDIQLPLEENYMSQIFSQIGAELS